MIFALESAALVLKITLGFSLLLDLNKKKEITSYSNKKD